MPSHQSSTVISMDKQWLVGEPASSASPAAEPSSRSTRVIEKMSAAEHLRMYWKFFFEKGERTPTVSLPLKKAQLSELYYGGRNQLKSIWLGHSSLLINIEGCTILTDPVLQRRLSPVGPVNFHKELPLAARQLNHLDAVLISHDHYDHLNKYSIQQLSGIADRFLVPTGVGRRLAGWGVAQEKIIELGLWQEYILDDRLTITATPAQHFSGRGLTDRNSTLWASWVVAGRGHRIFFSGDSGYFAGFREIGQHFGPFDMTFLECGAYNEKWSAIHMFPEQTVQAHRDLRGAVLHPIHWATFNLSMHPWYEPMERLVSAAWEVGVSLATPIVGECLDFNTYQPADLWWESAMEL